MLHPCDILQILPLFPHAMYCILGNNFDIFRKKNSEDVSALLLGIWLDKISFCIYIIYHLHEIAGTTSSRF